MSIASEISRISSNLSNAFTAVANKGVTVPSGSTSDNLANLIYQIEGGQSYTWDALYSNSSIKIEGSTSGYITLADFFQTHDPIVQGDVYRITWGSNTYVCVAEEIVTVGNYTGYCLGNATIYGGVTGNNEPFACMEMYTDDLAFSTTDTPGQRINLTIEKRVPIGGSVLVPKTITANGTYDPADDSADGYSSVSVSVPSSSPVLVSKTITANGTYNPASDNADGYSSVSVSVPMPPVVVGTFTPQTSEKGTYKSISLSYSGTGYPIAGIIYPSVGCLKTGDSLTSLVQRYVMLMWAFAKIDVSAAPNYSSNDDANKMDVVSYYKNSTTDASTTSSAKTHAARNYYNSNPADSSTSCVRFKSSTNMTLTVANTSYGFKDGVEYTYMILYSS